MACTQAIYDAILNGTGEFPPGYSWAGNPLGSAVVVKTLEILKEQDLVHQVAEKGKYLKEKLEQLAQKHPTVGDVRGLGLMVGLEFVKDKDTKETFAPEVKYAQQVCSAALERGMFLETSTGCDRGARGDMAMVAPAFIVTYPQLDQIVGVLDSAIAAAEQANGFAG